MVYRRTVLRNEGNRFSLVRFNAKAPQHRYGDNGSCVITDVYKDSFYSITHQWRTKFEPYLGE